MPTESVDAVIVGSGYGGAVPALRLAEAGQRVVVLERGRRLRTSDLRQSDAPQYIQSMTDVVVSGSNVAYRTGKLMGGASIPMDGAMFRIPSKSFEVREGGTPAGRRLWPEVYNRALLDPYYERAERTFGVRQFRWDEIPKAAGLFTKMLALSGASVERARLNYGDCLHCGFCAAGCIFDKKHTLMHTYLPQAETRGAILRDNCYAERIEPDGTRWKVLYTQGTERKEISCARLFLAGGGLNTPALLLRSRAALPRVSWAHVGEHFNHNGELPFVGILPAGFPGTEDYKCFKGMENGGVMSFHWYESEGFTLHPGAGLEPTIFASALAASNVPGLPRRAWGMEFKRFAEQVYPSRLIAFSSLGLADSHAAVTIKSDGTPDVVERDRSAYDRYLERLTSTVRAVAARAGATILEAYPRRYAGMLSAHLLAACRMSDRADDGVVDPDCRVWGYENLYVTDASAIPYALAVNPALNITVIAERAVERALARG